MRDFLKFNYYFFFDLIKRYEKLRNNLHGKVVVLTYHGIVPKIPNKKFDFEYRNFVTTSQFRRQIKHMLKSFDPLSPYEILKKKNNTRPGFLITFDDGFKNNLTYAAPILHEFGLTGCFFITTGLIEQTEMIWSEKITYWLAHTPKEEVVIKEISPKPIPLTKIAHRDHASQILRSYLKHLPISRRNEILGLLEEQIGLKPQFGNEEIATRYGMLSWRDIRKFSDYNQVVGSHSHNHPILTSLSPKESWNELAKSKSLIELNTDLECRLFSYPNGTEEDFSEVHIRQLKELGYKFAFTQIPGFVSKESHPYKLERLNITNKMTMPLFKATVSGFSLKKLNFCNSRNLAKCFFI